MKLSWRMGSLGVLVLIFSGLSAVEGYAQQETLRIVEDETVLSVVVQTTGVASRFAPDHFIHAGRYHVDLTLDPGRPEDASFEARVWAPDLVVNDRDLRDELEARLLELGILDDPYDEMSEEDREDVWTAMMMEGQLHASEHPWIEVEAVDIRRTDDEDFPWIVTAALIARGTRVEAPVHGRMEREGEAIRIEAFGEFHFTDLGIEPYSAFLGAVRNRDAFHVYLTLLAEPEGC